MFAIVWQKIRGQKGLHLCLLAGMTLFAALWSSYPMLLRIAGDRLLQKAFADAKADSVSFPAVLHKSGKWEADAAGQVLERLYAYGEKWGEYVDADAVAVQTVLTLDGGRTETSLGGRNYYLNFAVLPDAKDRMLTLEEEGEWEHLPCMVSEPLMDAYGLTVGEVIRFPDIVNEGGETLTFTVTGICREADITEPYWNLTLEELKKQLVISVDTADLLLRDWGISSVSCDFFEMLDYRQITSGKASVYLSYLQQFADADAGFSTNLIKLLNAYEKDMATVRRILVALTIPAFVLLLLFLSMVSTQIINSEAGETAVLRSRGAGAWQVMRLYFMRALALAAPAELLGTGLSCLLSAAMGNPSFSMDMAAMGLAACLIAGLFVTAPVWRLAKTTVVKQRAAGIAKKPLWLKGCLDGILVLLSVYLLYNFQRQREPLALQLAGKEPVDPMLLLGSSLFMTGCGLLAVRLCGLLVRFVDFLGKKRWSAVAYAAFLQVRRTWYKQAVIGIFLILTISGAIYDASLARTVSQNRRSRIGYETGCDLRYAESFPLRKSYSGTEGVLHWRYEEPDYGRYQELVESGSADITRVILDESAKISAGGKSLDLVSFYGIHTKEFGETARLVQAPGEEHWYHALNALAQSRYGVLLSSNAAEALGVKTGDSISCLRMTPVEGMEDVPLGQTTGEICGIVDNFPGFMRYTYTENAGGEIVEQEHYLVVMNYATAVNVFGLTPYELWMRVSDGGQDTVSAFLRENGQDAKFTSLEEAQQESENQALVQITNTLLVFSLFISIVICVPGFFIYWSMSMRQREMLFGIYRAMGVRRGEIWRMLFIEQFFSSFLAMLSGAAIGVLASRLFVPLVSLVYLPGRHNLPIRWQTDVSDLLYLGVLVAALMLAAAGMLMYMVSRLKIAQALRLGEDG
ncbi:MAG: FtsX-like permease family protein [Roseburia sp.]|nr:FtsX-like permease family protein [Roseburia sp.]MCM1431016.1 FtsX-like permease family protein [Muribaculaceae bacterium]